MSLKYEPSSEPLYISAKLLFVNREPPILCRGGACLVLVEDQLLQSREVAHCLGKVH